MVETMQQDQEGQADRRGAGDREKVAGLFDEAQAQRVADRLSAEGIPARVADGGFAAEGRFGSQIVRGAVAGGLIALPVGIVVALVVWSHNQAGVSPLVPMFFIGAAIVAIGAGIGAFFAVARGASLVEEPTAMVVASPPTAAAAAEASQTIQEAGGQATEPLVEREPPDSRPARGRAHLE